MGERERRFEGLACWRNNVRLVSLLEKMNHELQGTDLRESSLQKCSGATGEETWACSLYFLPLSTGIDSKGVLSPI